MRKPVPPILSLALKQLVLLLLIAGIPSAIAIRFNLRWEPSSEFRQINSNEARAYSKDLVFVDVRSKDRFDSAHIAGAVHFEEQDSESSIEAIRSVWNPKLRTVVYGEGTGSDRAKRVARMLSSALPSKNVLLLEGGWAAWPRD